MRYFIGGLLGLAWAGSAFAFHPQSVGGEHDERSTLHRVSMTHHHDANLSRALGIQLDSTTNGIIIADVYVSMPAYHAGLCKGDKLIAINHRPVVSLRAAVQQTQNIASNVVMVDVQRKDMRICRRVEVQDGQAQFIGSFKKGRTLALAISQFTAGVSDQFTEITKIFTPADIDTLILDLRDNAGGSRFEAQKIARSLGGSQSRGEPGLKVIVLQDSYAPSAVYAFADMLVQQRDAEIWGKNPNPALYNEASGSREAGPSGSRPTLPVQPRATEAPVQWNMAAFRKHYPSPDSSAALHPMLAANGGLAPILWGINGNAYSALALVQGIL